MSIDLFDKQQHDEFVAKIYEENKEEISFIDSVNEKFHRKECYQEFIRLRDEWRKQQDLPVIEVTSRYRDRFGNPITSGQMSILFQQSIYKDVRHERIGDYLISTVWLGINMSFFSSISPVIFETMVFPYNEDEEQSFIDRYCERYSTQQEALAGHERIVEMARTGNFEKDEDEIQ